MPSLDGKLVLSCSSYGRAKKTRRAAQSGNGDPEGEYWTAGSAPCS